MSGYLPAGFEALAAFADWCELGSQAERYVKRQTATMAELRAFYDAIVPDLEAIFTLLDAFPPGPLPDPEERLFRLTLGLAEVAQAVEVFDRPGIAYMRVPHDVEMAGIGTAAGTPL